MVEEFWQDDPEIKSGLTEPKQYAMLARSLLALVNSPNAETSQAADEYIDRLGLAQRVKHWRNIAAADADFKSKLKSFYASYFDAEPGRFERVFEAVHLKCRYYRFRANNDMAMSLYVYQMMLIEQKYVFELNSAKLDRFEVVCELKADGIHQVVIEDRMFRFKSMSSIATCDVINQILERQNSSDRIAILQADRFGRQLATAICCDWEMFQVLKDELGCRFPQGTIDFFEKFARKD